MSNQYETLYGVQLLDDLHNYFPALLYDTARFQSVRDVLGYITQNARNRFDLFSFGQRNYHQSGLAPAPAPARSVSPPMPTLRTRRNGPTAADISGQTNFATAATTYADAARRGPIQFSRVPVTESFEMLSEDIELPSLNLMNLVNLLNGFPTVPEVRRTTTAMQDVIVSASEAQIEAASTRAFPEEAAPCSICQDDIQLNEMARKLNHCGHTFHIRCIDTWFSRNVHCPICRHDIRDIDGNDSDTAPGTH